LKKKKKMGKGVRYRDFKKEKWGKSVN